MAQFYSAKRRVTTREIITVTISELDAFGQGVARYRGKALFIKGALPGEEVEVQLTEDKRHYAIAKVMHRRNDSPERVAPRCPHYGICGGCQLQHASVSLQQSSKIKALSKQFGLSAQGPLAGPEYGYRRRTRLGVVYDPRRAKLTMGFRKAASKELIDVRQCPILVPQLEALLAPLRSCLEALDRPRSLGHVELVAADNMPCMVLRYQTPLTDKDYQKLERFSHSHGLALFFAPGSDTLEQISGEPLYYHSDGLRLEFNPRDFIQVNNAVNQQMVTTALEWLMPASDERVLDLFCGMGNFTLPLARRAQSVVGVEGVPTLVTQAGANALKNGLKNVTFFHENLEENVTSQPWAGRGFDKVLLDPARAGAAGVMDHIVKLTPRRVVYVSCNPGSLQRDSKTLLDAGFKLTRLMMLDMFPHTAHLESMALFERR